MDGGRSTPEEYLAVAQRLNLPIQLTASSAGAVLRLRELAKNAGVTALIASDGPTTGADLIVSSVPSLNQTKTPFAMTIAVGEDGALDDGTSLSAAIERYDADAAARPWHYTLDCAHPSHARLALESLFRSAPSLAHRVIGMRSNATPDFASEMLACAQLFGLQLLGGLKNTTAEDLATLTG